MNTDFDVIGWTDKKKIGKHLFKVHGLRAIIGLSRMDKAFSKFKNFENTFGITSGDFCHGLIDPSQWWDHRPVKDWANYETPLENLYLCGSAAHPGPGVTCIPGFNAANAVLKNLGLERYTTPDNYHPES